MTLGLLLLLAALGLTGYNIWESKRAEIASDKAVVAIEEEIENLTKEEIHYELGETPDYMKYPQKEMPTMEIDGERYIGYIEIPDIHRKLPVMAGEWSYAKLRKAPCHYEGSVYQDNMVIAGHNYRSHFSLIKQLDMGSEIRFTDAEGNVFVYEAAWVDIIKPQDIEGMTDAADWDLTLFTCTYGGRDRYTLRCIRQNAI